MSLQCRIIDAGEFTTEFELFVMNSFFQDEPMNKCLKTKIPNEIDLPWLRYVLNKAKVDNLSLGFYDENYSRSSPVAYAINHYDQRICHQCEDTLYSSLNKTCSQKHEHISEILTKLYDNINLFEKFNCENLLHIYLLGVDPNYRQTKLATQLVDASVHLAQEKNLDMVYAEVTSNYSLKAFLKHDFQLVKTINYNSYENGSGEKIFQPIHAHEGCSIVIKDLRTK